MNNTTAFAGNHHLVAKIGEKWVGGSLTSQGSSLLEVVKAFRSGSLNFYEMAQLTLPRCGLTLKDVWQDNKAATTAHLTQLYQHHIQYCEQHGSAPLHQEMQCLRQLIEQLTPDNEADELRIELEGLEAELLSNFTQINQWRKSAS